LEAVRPHQVEALIDIAEKEGQSLCEVVQRSTGPEAGQLERGRPVLGYPRVPQAWDRSGEPMTRGTLAWTLASYTPSLWDWIVLVALEVQRGLFLVLTTFWLPISDWLMRRRLRKEQEWKRKHAIASE